jgi:membrane-associated phospholipid phosphatase
MILALTVNTEDYWKDHKILTLNAKFEILICLVLLGLAYASIEIHKSKKNDHTEFTIGSLDNKSIEQINAIDRSIAGRWDIEAKNTGKLFKNIAIYLIPFSLFLFAGSLKRRVGLFFIFTQGYILAETLTGLTKGLVDRYRPFAYMTNSGLESLSAKAKEKFLEDIFEYDILNSFFSGDASILAYGFVFFAISYSWIYKKATYKTAVWMATFLAVFLGCYFRVLSGKHFPSDVIVGAIVGTLVALGILLLHKNRKIESL